MIAIYSLFLFLIAFIQPAYAYDPCLSVSGEWLYFLPTFDQPDYIVKGDPNRPEIFDIERSRINQKFCPGYRVGIEFDIDCFPNLTVAYTHYNQELTASKSSPDNLYTVLGTPEAANAGIDGARGRSTFSEQFRFDSIDGLAQFYHLKCNRTEFLALAGIKYARLHFTDNFFFRSNFNILNSLTVTDNLTSIAVGPQIAFNGNWQIASCLQIFGSLQSALLASAAKTSLNQVTTGIVRFNQSFTENPEWFWHVIESLDLRIGLATGTIICLPQNTKKIPLNVEAGYEFILLWKMINRMYFTTTTAEGLSFNEWSDFTLQGPFVRLEVSY